MSVISPSITAYTVEEFHQQLDSVKDFANRLHIDLGDGEYTTQTIGLEDVKVPADIIFDIHLMYQQPLVVLDEIVPLVPHLVIVQSDAENVEEVFKNLIQHGIKVGIAVTQQTTIDSVAHLVTLVDHVLIFSGTLGSFGGHADLSLLHKVSEIKVLNPDAEIGWDGGAKEDNVVQMSSAGVDIIVVGGAIQRSKNPSVVYAELESKLTD